MSKKNTYSVGQKYKDFVVTKYFPLPEINADLIELVHEPSNAQIMQIANDDDENLFSLSFQTLPSSSNGVPHILEHTVLCGSKKFPVKDPFFAMRKRSLNTFMNAMTGADFTCYPAASQSEKDFYNLLEVYVDAVFHPELKKLSFLQEGHRLEFSKPNDPNSPLIYKGIVFNEMKGSLASPDHRLWHELMKNLLPDLTYANNSGGDPKEIPNLTYAELLEFHKYYYHPSHCLFFFYGNIPLQKHLDFLSKEALKDVKKLPAIPPIPKQRQFSKPVEVQGYYPAQESGPDKNIIAFGLLTSPIVDQKESLAIAILDNILMENDASPLKLAILKSGLCTEVDSSLDSEMSEVPWVIVCKGCRAENKEPLFALIQKTLKNIVKKGIDKERIETALHQLEFARGEISSNGTPYGLSLFFRAALVKQHGGLPEDALKIHSLFAELDQDLKRPNYLTDLICKYFIDNKHLVKLLMIPDHDLGKKEDLEEKERLEKIKQNLSPKEISQILEQTKTLEKFQQELEHSSLECLPKIALSEIPKTGKEFPLKSKSDSINICHHSVFTNNILYADLVFPLPALQENELRLLPIFVSLLHEIGAGKRDYKANLDYISAHTGGIEAYLSLYTQVSNSNECRPAIALRGKAFQRKSAQLFEIFLDIAENPHFNEKERIAEILLQYYTMMESALNHNAMRYAVELALSGFSTPSYIYNIWHGLPFFQWLQNIVKNLDQELPKLIQDLQSLKEKVLPGSAGDLVLSCSDEQFVSLEKAQFFDIQKLKAKEQPAWNAKLKIDAVPSQGRVITSPVAFTVLGFHTIGIMNEASPLLSLATHLLENRILHPQIREQGGAYGSGAAYMPNSATFYLYSYRDPAIARTLKIFDTAIMEIAEGSFSEEDLEEAKLMSIQRLDAPIGPGNRGAVAYTWEKEGKTKEIRQKFRDTIIKGSKKNVQNALKEQIASQKGQGVTISFSGKELLTQENEKLNNSLKILTI